MARTSGYRAISEEIAGLCDGNGQRQLGGFDVVLRKRVLVATWCGQALGVRRGLRRCPC